MRALVTLITLLGIATTAYGELDVGEPRTVRLIYLVLHGNEYNPQVDVKLRESIVEAQQFYASQLDMHGYGYKEFRIERDAKGEPLVHVVKQRHAEEYTRAVHDIFDTRRNIYVIVYDNGKWILPNGFGGFALLSYSGNMENEGGTVTLPTHYTLDLMIHELGHTFRLYHNFTEPNVVMSYDPNRQRIAECNVRALAMHPYFNDEIVLAETTKTNDSRHWLSDTIDLVIPDTFKPTDRSIDMTVKAKHHNGIYHVLIMAHSESDGTLLAGCHEGDGSAELTFDFKYTGFTNHLRHFKIGELDEHILIFEVIDMKGNYYFIGAVIKKEPSVIVEDVNADGIVNVLDLIVISNHISDGSFDPTADINGDGVIDILDLVSVSQALQ